MKGLVHQAKGTRKPLWGLIQKGTGRDLPGGWKGYRKTTKLLETLV